METVNRYSNIKNLNDLLAVKAELKAEIAVTKSNLEDNFSTTKDDVYYGLVKPGVKLAANVSKKMKYVSLGYRVAKIILRLFRKKRR